MGLLTTYPHKIKIIGDKSLSKRPMERIITPLGKFGATFMPKNKKTLPCYMIGSEMPIAISHKEKIGSAQVKSSIILASLNTPGITKIKELKKSRDHTENMLKFIRAKIKIKKFKTYIGLGYHDTFTPSVIQRNILENPGWYTSYTPYQAEIAQGRLEALLNFQTMVCDLTKMEIANASLLDESTSAAEAMTLLYNNRTVKQKTDKILSFFIDENILPQTRSVLETRAKPIGIKLEIGDISKIQTSKYFGCIIQYPGKHGKGRPDVKKISSSVIKVEGNNCLAPMVLNKGIPELIKAAKESGVAVLAITNSHHMAAMWPETEKLAEEGLVAFACTSYKPAVAPAGAIKPLFGTNPISFAWPRPGKTPVVYDMATASMAMGEVQVAKREGHKVPLGTGLTKDGKETTDPGQIADGGVLLPFGGYKGGFRRVSWEEILELIAASNIHTVQEYGPDRIIGFSPIPAMSMISYASGSRFLQLMGGINLSFYDWYCDLPCSFPEIWGVMFVTVYVGVAALLQFLPAVESVVG